MNGRILLRSGDHEWSVSVDQNGHVDVDRTRMRVTAAGDGAWRAGTDNRQITVFAATESRAVWVHVAGRVYRFVPGAAIDDVTRRAAAADQGLSSPMPATVRAVMVTVGQQVRTGDAVLMLEAMKMELPIRTPRDGTVTAIHCREGELVQPGLPLIQVS
jgi:3-methylcrotonyl-CoA carboxylase alpha subunit